MCEEGVADQIKEKLLGSQSCYLTEEMPLYVELLVGKNDFRVHLQSKIKNIYLSSVNTGNLIYGHEQKKQT